MDSTQLQQALAGLDIPAVRSFASVGSTNDVALEWIGQGAPDGALVVADEQTAGRGRLNRHWVTHPGAALALSLVVRPSPAESEHFGLFAPLAAVALQSVLAEQYNLPTEIKWPNDVLIRRKKTAGILVEAEWDGSRALGVVIGIGVNITPAALPPPEATLYPATCVETELGSPVDRLAVLRELLVAIHVWRNQLGTPAFFRQWERHLAFLQEPIRIESAGQAVYNGIMLGVDPAGNLRLRQPDGQERTIAVGDVRVRPEG
jgi:BirA family biotin operon repressor/biotin-[acetyl-CoA-carboxylase] ligase